MVAENWLAPTPGWLGALRAGVPQLRRRARGRCARAHRGAWRSGRKCA